MVENLLGPQDNCCYSDDAVEVDFSSLGDLCAAMPRRLLVTGILVQWMRYHFTYAINIESTFLKTILWNPSLSQTQIIIDSVFKYNPAATELRPGIYVKPGKWSIVRLGIEDRKMGSNDPSWVCDPTHTTGKEAQFNTFIQGSHTLFCIAGESAEVEILANEVYKELVEFAPAARRQFGMLKLVVSDIGEPALLEESKEHFVVAITIAYNLQLSWILCNSACLDNMEFIQQGIVEMLER